ncbi:thioredoxin domain-containing protein [Celeribacter litoreus]|uniref:hypothetical protein n=1 Tax=Celeribacter litoreus TaxID=2876714 RepID=UPI001CC91F14|nr:hypothetical protein [Celeribacter litoreus]MCA0044538.1 hypothetical protein [Celeribacter litoreus]
MLRILPVLITILPVFFTAILPAAAMELVMVERKGCVYCARWEAEIGPIYPKTPEGAFAPLRHIDLGAPMPEDLTFKGPVIFTPTFVLVDEGEEIGRIEGYAGDELFWAMLTVTLRDKAGFIVEETPAVPITN